MIHIQVNNPVVKKFVIHKHFESQSSFFLYLMDKVDNYQLASWYVKVGSHRQEMDFGYDFLAIYDFLNIIVAFINTPHEIGDEIDLLLYESGSDRLQFICLENGMMEIHYRNENEVLGKEVISGVEINRIFEQLLKDFGAIKLHFLFNDENNELFEDWLTTIRQEIVLYE